MNAGTVPYKIAQMLRKYFTCPTCKCIGFLQFTVCLTAFDDKLKYNTLFVYKPIFLTFKKINVHYTQITMYCVYDRVGETMHR